MEQTNRISNPVIPGFYPDPSICRVGEDFYLVCSSFELYPGIPVFHSKDLAHWEQISYAMTMENGFHVNANMGTGGVMAPTIRWQDGTFYIINANFGDKGNFYISATDPAGPWSSPHWITDIPDIDCSLFFDRDGSCYLVSPGDDPAEDNGRAIFLTPYDIEKGCVRGERRKIWNSAMRKAWAPEAPHLYHIGNYYYLMIAEGGTEHFHSVVIARSETVDGWYEGYKGNPIMTHRHLGKNYPIDNVGHADLVDTPEGDWYAVLLGSRNIEGIHKNLGRETWLCPVEWEEGWPLFSPGSGKVEWDYPANAKLPWTVMAGEPEWDDFAQPLPEHLRMHPASGQKQGLPERWNYLGRHWSFWGVPYQDFWNIENSCMKLRCLPRPMARQLYGFDVGHPDMRRDDGVSFLGRRQRWIHFDLLMEMGFLPGEGEAAGLLVMQASNHQLRMEKTRQEGKTLLRLVQVTTRQKGLPFLPGYEASSREEILAEQEIEAERLVLKLTVRKQQFRFYYGENEHHFQLLGEADGRNINPGEIGGMIGTMIGMFATANGRESNNTASFDYFAIIPVIK